MPKLIKKLSRTNKPYSEACSSNTNHKYYRQSLITDFLIKKCLFDVRFTTLESPFTTPIPIPRFHKIKSEGAPIVIGIPCKEDGPKFKKSIAIDLLDTESRNHTTRLLSNLPQCLSSLPYSSDSPRDLEKFGGTGYSNYQISLKGISVSWPVFADKFV
ncbi:hypothetical protein [unidentified bacterial endosymbiont]|uniref:hypothetical protein n=1 Tax=unidentified bacterial endosymbiont TaxID=2355 RepID=UPI0020A1379B|nr:hypothetical protein [unidentified bacterial endosymbiont]